MSRPLVATDLDRTLIYSRRAAGDAGEPLRCVERRDGADASFMTARAADEYAQLAARELVVPVTTRTVEQYRRVTLPGRPPRYAVAANGGVLLVEGRADAEWADQVRRALTRVAPLDEIWTEAARLCRAEWTTSLRGVPGLFCYAVVDRRRLPRGFVAEVAAWATHRGWRVSLQGCKLYWVPEPLRKSAAVCEVARRCATTTVLAAGDSLLDADLLEASDAGIVARHGELVASGWSAPHVDVSTNVGVMAGAEIVSWLAARVTDRR